MIIEQNMPNGNGSHTNGNEERNENGSKGHELSYQQKYDLLTARVREMLTGTTADEFNKRCGKGTYELLSAPGGIDKYLGVTKKKVSERLETVSQDIRDAVRSMNYTDLRTWYTNVPEGTKGKQKTQREVAYRERLVDLVAAKFGISIEAPVKRNGNGRIKTAADLQNLCDSDPKARYLIELCGGNDVDIADIIAVIYDGKISRDDAINLLQNPSLRDYLGNFKKPVSIVDIGVSANELLPLDKNGVIADIVSKRLIECRRLTLGPKPTARERKSFMKEMEGTLENLLGGNNHE